MNESCRISEKLIAIIQENGPEYPEREPFRVYLALMKDHVTNHKIAGAVLNVFLSEIISHMERYGNVPELSEAIQEKCGFCQEVSSTMAETLLQVYSEETIERQVAEALTDYLDEIFDDYCTCDPDYPPAVEDFDIDVYIEAWCENSHFEFQSSTGHGYDCGYEADS